MAAVSLKLDYKRVLRKKNGGFAKLVSPKSMTLFSSSVKNLKSVLDICILAPFSLMLLTEKPVQPVAFKRHLLSKSRCVV